MKRLLLTTGCLALLAGLLLAAEESTQPDISKLPPAAQGPMDFARDIQPIFKARCLRCHGPEKQKGGLRLDSRAAALDGSNSGEVIIPGKGTASRLLHVVGGLDEDTRMPPTGKLLTAVEIGRLRAWIDQGAKWNEKKIIAKTGSVRSKHWAFQPVQRPALPKVAQSNWCRNEIDAFILARLEVERVVPSPEADRVTLIRRLSLDLLGLPPAPEEVDAFVNDRRADAYERLVDRLLASPHYGERWGRHWLDVARYADSDGFEKDTGRPYAWRYRHWVIAALNRDLPFDQFTIEQLAGDLLPSATVEQKVATGFHRNTLTNKEGGVDPEQFRVEQVVDRVNTTAKAFLGVTLGCAECHDHKYDPFSQREYYQMFAFFNSDREVDIAAPLLGEASDAETEKKLQAAFLVKKTALTQSIAAYRAQLAANLPKWEAALSPQAKKKLPANITAILALPAKERNPKQQKELAGYHAKTDPKLASLRKALAKYEQAGLPGLRAQTLALGPARKTHVMIRGDFLRPGVEVTPGTPAVLPPMKTTGKPKTGTGLLKSRVLSPFSARTRLDLARWIVNPANPLTARVTVNWMWHRYFGRGLVATLEDVGTQGEKPSHPKLLDWLATELIRQKWSMKAMHKRIVQSATYRQSSKDRPELRHRDANNVWLARQNRLRAEAEIVRDLALASSGLLVRRIGGPSVRPPQPAGISELTYAGSARWIESKGPDRYRRGMYTWFQRTSPYPMLMTFDSPDSNVCCVRRERTNTPLQALTLLNDPVFIECAQALGRRVRGFKTDQVEERIRYAFRLCLARQPTAGELDVLGKLYADLLEECRKQPEKAAKLVGKMKGKGRNIADAAAWVALARTIMNLDEFVTRE